VAVNVIALRKFTKRIPKNSTRRNLISEGRIKTLYFYRDDDENCVDSEFKKEFGLSSYIILDCNQSGYLFESALSKLNGSQAIDRRRGLYICEVSFSPICCIYGSIITRICLLFIVLHIV